MASNNWVIHGNHTKNGKPLLAADPHLGNQIPSTWYLMEIHYENKYLIGASHPGIPYVMLGKTNHMSWAVTSSLTDMSDLFKEQISADGRKYLVDGVWRDLIIEQNDIKVKGRDEPVKFEVKWTHRGPVMSSDLLAEAKVLFSEGLPEMPKKTSYSLAWTGHAEKENTINFLRTMVDSTTAQGFMDDLLETPFFAVP